MIKCKERRKIGEVIKANKKENRTEGKTGRNYEKGEDHEERGTEGWRLRKNKGSERKTGKCERER